MRNWIPLALFFALLLQGEKSFGQRTLVPGVQDRPILGGERSQNIPPAALPSSPQESVRNAPPSTPESMELLDNNRKLVIGDRLSYRVAEDRGEIRPLFVTDSGEIEFPLIGRVSATNKTMKDLAYEVKRQLDKKYYYNATVLIGLDATSKFRGRIYLIGSVAGVGPMDLPADEVLTVSKAILRAGGFGDFANQRKVRLIRKGAPGGEPSAEGKGGKKEEIIVDCKKIYEGKSDTVDPVLQADDMIIVPQRLINF